MWDSAQIKRKVIVVGQENGEGKKVFKDKGMVMKKGEC